MVEAGPTDGKPERVWLEPSWLSWEAFETSAQPLDQNKAQRPYEMYEHACNRLADGTTKLDRVDAITTLKRTVTQRVRVLKEAYRLKGLQIPDRPKGDLELLAFLGLVRPLMLRRLIAIRNIVEHEDSDPPTDDECLVFADLVWYFLRSTDVLARWRLTDYNAAPQELADNVRPGDPRVRVEYADPPRGKLRIHAFLRQDAFAYEPRLEWIEILENRGATPRQQHKSDDPTWVEGEFAPGSQMKLIWTWYFSRAFER